MQREPGGEAGEFAEEGAVAAESQVGAYPVLHGGQPQLFQPQYLGPQHPARCHIGERRSAPQQQGPLQELGGFGGVPGLQCCPAPPGELFEAGRVRAVRGASST